MGQYYVSYIKTEGGEKILSPRGGVKLMEHSWWNNSFCDGVAKLIYGKPSIVGWIGDYANDVGCDPEIYKKCWEKGLTQDFEGDEDFSLFGKYLVNYSKDEWVDLDKYYRNSYAATRKKEKGPGEVWVPHPLSLLTAVGNGQGGGDYGDGLCEDMVGIWGLDKISIEDAVPENMKEICPVFMGEVWSL